MRFERQYGDLILWEQLIAEAANRPFKKIILITGDNKEDWWWFERGRTIGPRPELVSELRTRAKVEQFYMYSAHRFMQYAQQYLKATITKESIDQVREVAELKRVSVVSSGTDPYRLSERLVLDWMMANHPEARIFLGQGFPDYFLIPPVGPKKAFEIKYVGRHTNPAKWMTKAYYHSIRDRKNLQGVEVVFVFVMKDKHLVGDFAARLDRSLFPFGYVVGVMEEGIEFSSLVSREPLNF